ncbi:MAG: class I SAM-dependent methyltransferase [Saprospiraceae bacterium]|nr:class I SAM-dependent methyltransferase [Saprospiraceae bacterium]
MKKWVLKAIVQKTISFLPAKHRINFFFQKYITKGVILSETYFMDRLGHAKDHITGYQKYVGSLEGKTSLELGSGWFPVVPVALFLSGIEQARTLDISHLLNRKRLLTTLEQYKEYHNQDRLAAYLDIIPERWAIIEAILAKPNSYSTEKILEQLHIRYLVADARRTKLEENSIDLIHSNNTFEHIYDPILSDIIREFDRIVCKNVGLQSHFIDMSDHFAHFDQSINIYNFLQYSDKRWNRIDNSIQPQNRYRMSDYLKIYRQLGIPLTEITKRDGDPNEVKLLKIAAKYKDYTLEDLAISHCHIYSKYELS